MLRKLIQSIHVHYFPISSILLKSVNVIKCLGYCKAKVTGLHMKNNTELKWDDLLILNDSMDPTLELTGISWHKWPLLYKDFTLMKGCLLQKASKRSWTLADVNRIYLVNTNLKAKHHKRKQV